MLAAGVSSAPRGCLGLARVSHAFGVLDLHSGSARALAVLRYYHHGCTAPPLGPQDDADQGTVHHLHVLTLPTTVSQDGHPMFGPPPRTRPEKDFGDLFGTSTPVPSTPCVSTRGPGFENKGKNGKLKGRL